MLRHVTAINDAISVLVKDHIREHGILLTLVRVIDGDDHGVVLFDTLGQLEGRHLVQVERDHTRHDLLLLPRTHHHLLDVVLSVRRVEHLGRIVRILLLCDTDIDSDVGIAQRVHRE